MAVLWGKRGHYRAKELALSLLYPVHLVCPIISADYTLLTTIARLCRRNDSIYNQMSRLVAFFQQRRSSGIGGNFPVSRLLEVVASLGCALDSTLTIHSPLHVPVSLVESVGSFLGHHLRELFRIKLWLELRERSKQGERSDFGNLQIIDIKATTMWYRQLQSNDLAFSTLRLTLELVVTGAIATFSRLHRHQEPIFAGGSPPSSAVCPFCDALEEEDVHHLFWKCSAWESIRGPFLQRWAHRWKLPLPTSSQLAMHGLAAEDPDLLLWRKNNFTPEWQYEAAPFPSWLGDGDAQHDEECRLIVYTDGACKHQADDRIRSAGCGIFVAKDHPWNTSFVLPGVSQSSELAELRAVVHAVEGATAQNIDIIVKLDNEYVADHAAAILAGSLAWPASGHRLWRRLAMAQSAQLAAGGGGHAAKWIKGHSTETDVADGILTVDERRGNLAADHLASLAATSSGCPVDIIERAALRKLQTFEVQKYLVEILLVRRLALIERLSPQTEIFTSQPRAGERCNRALDMSIVQDIRSAFLALHCF